MMDPKELVRRIANNATPQPETDWAGRKTASRSEIEGIIHKTPKPLSNRTMRRLERQRQRGIEKG